MQGHLEVMAVGQADVGSPSRCPIAWPRQSPAPCPLLAVPKQGPGLGSQCHAGAGVHAAVWAAWLGSVHASCSAAGCQQDQAQPEPWGGCNALARMQAVSWAPACAARQGGEGPQGAGIWPWS